MRVIPSVLAFALVLWTGGCAAPRNRDQVAVPSLLTPGARVLFQGDSITDGNRGRNEDPNHILGHGYQFLIACRFGGGAPERGLVFLNRGVSGNRVSDLAGRWRRDALDLHPDVLSILIGINDLNSGVSAGEYESGFDQLLRETRAALPRVRLVLCEPFALPVGGYARDWEQKKADLVARRAVVARLAERHGAVLVRFQQTFDDALHRAPAEHWIWDGIHPTYAGHQIMADAWIRAVAAAGSGSPAPVPSPKTP